MYEKAIQGFIDNGGTRKEVIERWLKKIDALWEKKSTYEDILKQSLNSLNGDFSTLKMQAQELVPSSILRKLVCSLGKTESSSYEIRLIRADCI